MWSDGGHQVTAKVRGCEIFFLSVCVCVHALLNAYDRDGEPADVFRIRLVSRISFLGSASSS